MQALDRSLTTTTFVRQNILEHAEPVLPGSTLSVTTIGVASSQQVLLRTRPRISLTPACKPRW